MLSKSINLYIVKLFFVFTIFSFSFNKVNAQQVEMCAVWVGSTPTTAYFDVYVTNTGTVPLKFNGVVLRFQLSSPSMILTGGLGTLSWNWVAGSTPISNIGNSWNNWPNYLTNLPYTASSSLFSYTPSSTFFVSATAPDIPYAPGIKIGRFRINVTGGTWSVPSSQFGFTWSTTAAVIAYSNGSSSTTTLQSPTGSFCNSSGQPLTFSSLISGVDSTGVDTICNGNTATLNVATTGGVSPYIVTISDANGNTTSATGTSPISFSVNPTSNQSYYVTSVIDANGIVASSNQGIAYVVVNPINNITYITACDSFYWANTGQLYTSSGIYLGTTFGCITQQLNLTITPSTSNASLVNACNFYTWANNGQTYSSSGLYTHISNCSIDTLNLLITNGTSTTQTVNAINSYTWPVNNQTYTSSGLYSFINGCDTTNLDLTIDFPASTLAINNENDFSIFPNPTKKEITIETNLKTSSTYAIKLVDVSGRVLKEITNVGQSKLNINISNVDAGIYFIQLIENNQVIKTKQIRKE
jgi:hypothetical protein